ncbi:hypothetical protein, partial [Streptomyces sp. URMC 124]|uniref:hypothetical protein n=1 Tax=Streptomyces sp. URMC 124 TaxID=3423405 RepID=UPI003F199321
RIDAVMQTPDNRNQYWIFSGNQYALIEVADGSHSDKQITGPRPLTNWTSLEGLTGTPQRIDAVMQTPDNRNQYWIFSGNQYALIEVADGTRSDKQVRGPRSLSDWKGSFRRAEERARDGAR